MNKPQIVFTGNLCKAIDMRVTQTGKTVVKFTVASTPRFQGQDGKWQNGETTYYDCEQWNQAGENTAASLNIGNAVIVIGAIRTESWDHTDPATGTVTRRSKQVVEVDDLGASTKFTEIRVAAKSERPNAAF